MDDHFGDLYGIISDREIEISHELAQFVLEYEVLLTTASDICGELDRYNHPDAVDLETDTHSLLALAQGAKIYNMSRPSVTRENTVHIRGGR
jgi:DNA mismatch repair protein MSH5